MQQNKSQISLQPVYGIASDRISGRVKHLSSNPCQTKWLVSRWSLRRTLESRYTVHNYANSMCLDYTGTYILVNSKIQTNSRRMA